MPKTASHLVSMVLKRIAVKNAPELSIKKSLFGFEMSISGIGRNFFCMALMTTDMFHKYYVIGCVLLWCG